MSGYNIHRELFKLGYQLNFEGIRRLQPRRRYIGVQYQKDIRERLKFAAGESGYGTLLALEDELEPQAALQFYPTKDDETYYIALAITRRQIVYGYNTPIPNMQTALIMTNLRKSSFHGADTDGMQFYHRESPDYFTSNPYLMETWERTSGSFLTDSDTMPFSLFPSISNFIGDGIPGAIPYPPPETKEKTVNESDGPALEPSDARAIADIRNTLGPESPFSDSTILTAYKQECQWASVNLGIGNTYSDRIESTAAKLRVRESDRFRSYGLGRFPPPMPNLDAMWMDLNGPKRPGRRPRPAPEPPEPRSKNKRMIRFSSQEDKDA